MHWTTHSKEYRDRLKEAKIEKSANGTNGGLGSQFGSRKMKWETIGSGLSPSIEDQLITTGGTRGGNGSRGNMLTTSI